MHKKPHSDAAKAKMRAARAGQPRKWADLPELEILARLLATDATTRGIASEYGCSDSTIKVILRRHTTPEQRLELRRRKQAASLKGYKHSPEFAEKSARRMADDNPFKGKSHSEEFKAAQSARKRGKELPPHVGVATSARAQGIAVEFWDGYATTESHRQRHGMELRIWRDAVFARDNYTCQMCGRRGGRLQPHHIKTFAKHPELRFEVSNGVTLCHDPCHKMTFGKEKEFVELPNLANPWIWTTSRLRVEA